MLILGSFFLPFSISLISPLDIFISLPPLFNPLKTISVEHSSHGDNSSHKNSWNKTRKQLYNCTLLLIMYFGNSPTNKALFSIKRELENPNYLDYFPKKQIKSINTYLSKVGITFQFVLNEMRKNNKIREFKYDLLIEYSNKLGITQHFWDILNIVWVYNKPYIKN